MLEPPRFLKSKYFERGESAKSPLLCGYRESDPNFDIGNVVFYH